MNELLTPEQAAAIGFVPADAAPEPQPPVDAPAPSDTTAAQE